MFHISFELLDTVLTFTKYREYNFLNKKISIIECTYGSNSKFAKKSMKPKKTNEIY